MRYRLALLSAMFLTGCGVTTPQKDNPIADHYWGLRKLQSEKIEQSEVELATVRFRADGGVDGTAICNSVSTGLKWLLGEVSKRGEIINSSNHPLVKTAVGCGEARDNDVADNFWKRMETSGRWLSKGRQLRIVFKDGSIAELVRVATPASERRPSCTESDSNNWDCRS